MFWWCYGACQAGGVCTRQGPASRGVQLGAALSRDSSQAWPEFWMMIQTISMRVQNAKALMGGVQL